MSKIYDPLLVSNNFIERGILENEKISPMKLQKLLYFLYRDYLQLTRDPLFSERFEAWKYGPVLSCVYGAFKKYGSGDIKTYYVNEEGKKLKINEHSNPAFRKVFDEVWNKYSCYSGIDLSQMTHQDGTAWHKAWTSYQSFLSDTDILTEEVGN